MYAGKGSERQRQELRDASEKCSLGSFFSAHVLLPRVDPLRPPSPETNINFYSSCPAQRENNDICMQGKGANDKDRSCGMRWTEI
jgi:hypothetical protein